MGSAEFEATGKGRMFEGFGSLGIPSGSVTFESTRPRRALLETARAAAGGAEPADDGRDAARAPHWSRALQAAASVEVVSLVFVPDSLRLDMCAFSVADTEALSARMGVPVLSVELVGLQCPLPAGALEAAGGLEPGLGESTQEVTLAEGAPAFRSYGYVLILALLLALLACCYTRWRYAKLKREKAQSPRSAVPAGSAGKSCAVRLSEMAEAAHDALPALVSWIGRAARRSAAAAPPAVEVPGCSNARHDSGSILPSFVDGATRAAPGAAGAEEGARALGAGGTPCDSPNSLSNLSDLSFSFPSSPLPAEPFASATDNTVFALAALVPATADGSGQGEAVDEEAAAASANGDSAPKQRLSLPARPSLFAKHWERYTSAMRTAAAPSSAGGINGDSAGEQLTTLDRVLAADSRIVRSSGSDGRSSTDTECITLDMSLGLEPAGAGSCGSGGGGGGIQSGVLRTSLDSALHKLAGKRGRQGGAGAAAAAGVHGAGRTLHVPQQPAAHDALDGDLQRLQGPLGSGARHPSAALSESSGRSSSFSTTDEPHAADELRLCVAASVAAAPGAPSVHLLPRRHASHRSRGHLLGHAPAEEGAAGSPRAALLDQQPAAWPSASATDLPTHAHMARALPPHLPGGGTVEHAVPPSPAALRHVATTPAPAAQHGEAGASTDAFVKELPRRLPATRARFDAPLPDGEAALPPAAPAGLRSVEAADEAARTRTAAARTAIGARQVRTKRVSRAQRMQAPAPPTRDESPLWRTRGPLVGAGSMQPTSHMFTPSLHSYIGGLDYVMAVAADLAQDQEDAVRASLFPSQQRDRSQGSQAALFDERRAGHRRMSFVGDLCADALADHAPHGAPVDVLLQASRELGESFHVHSASHESGLRARRRSSEQAEHPHDDTHWA